MWSRALGAFSAISEKAAQEAAFFVKRDETGAEIATTFF
jgi:hypothetical protein